MDYALKKKRSLELDGRYRLGVGIIFLIGFASFYEVSFLNLGVLFPFLVSLFVTWALSFEDKIIENTLDRSIGVKHGFEVEILSTALTPKSYYYPAIKENYVPIFSAQSLANLTVAATTIIFYLSALLMGVLTGEFWPSVYEGSLAVAGCVVASWAWAVILSGYSLIKIKRAQKLDLPRYVELSRTKNQADKLLEKQPVRYYLDRSVARSKTQDVIKKLINDSYDIAPRLNALISDGYVNADMLAAEIAIVERAFDFATSSIETSLKFMAKNKNNLKAAQAVHRNEIEPRVQQTAVELNEKLVAVRQTVRAIEDKRKQEWLASEAKIHENNKKKISVDQELQALGYDKPLPVPYFKDFHALEFDNEQSKVAATNIVKNSLPTLLQLKESAVVDGDRKKIDAQISKVHNFVRSIAKNTDESKVRKAKLLAKEKQNPLYLSGGNKEVNDVDNTIAINERYLESYDNILPIEKD